MQNLLSVALALLLLTVWFVYDTWVKPTKPTLAKGQSPRTSRSQRGKAESVSSMGMDDKQLKDFLLQIYNCGVQFTLSISPSKPKRHMGLYHVGRQHITVYAGWCKSLDNMKETAIHEYAHHICYTRMGMRRREVHSQRFWQVYAALTAKAVEKGLYRPSGQPILQEIMSEK